jgi:uncharacterized membrane protein YgcG
LRSKILLFLAWKNADTRMFAGFFQAPPNHFPSAKDLLYFPTHLTVPCSGCKTANQPSLFRRSQHSQIAHLEATRLKNIFVGNLDFNTSEEELRQMFEAHGQVDRVSIMTDRDTGRSRGFGFVEMTNTEEGDKAIAALNGTQVGGRTLNVNEARPKVERGGGGGGGGGRDRGDRGGRGGGGGGRGRY